MCVCVAYVYVYVYVCVCACVCACVCVCVCVCGPRRGMKGIAIAGLVTGIVGVLMGAAGLSVAIVALVRTNRLSAQVCTSIHARILFDRFKGEPVSSSVHIHLPRALFACVCVCVCMCVCVCVCVCFLFLCLCP